MREIKFRAWDGGMFEDVVVVGDSWTDNLVSDYWHNGNIMQYTGLKDKNGKEIYEGDILELENLQIEIKYLANAFVGVYNGIQKDLWPPLENKNYLQWEVVGNIHETPAKIKCGL